MTEEEERTLLTIQQRKIKKKRISFKIPLKIADFLKNRDLFIILTVPHSVCVADYGHNCDITALKNAKQLSKAFNIKKFENRILVGDINRRETDLNRDDSRNTNFQRELDNLIEKFSKDYNILLLDIHSGDFGDYSLVILKLKSFFELELLNLIQNETNAVIIIGADENYIVNKALQQDIPALLLEFNETLKYRKYFYLRIVKAISLWYNQYFIE